MSPNFASLQAFSLRRAALVGALAVVAAASFVGDTTPARAFGMRHGGGGGFHGGFGGFRHEGFRDFHRGFDRRFAFGFGVFPGYYDYSDAYDGCLRREWGPYGWRLINICY
jgi:hypothetical protein